VPRAAISGGAGTGKSVLAVEEARRLVDSGARVLFVCFNRGLATEVRHRLRGDCAISVFTFHELCAEMARCAGIPRPEAASETQLFEEIYPELLMQAFEHLTEVRYDAIIIDEGQDFLPLWWTAIEAGLAPDGKQLLRIFYDSNQRVYQNVTQLPDDVALVPIRLTLNLRNTRRIHELVRQHYTGHEIEALGPEGVEVRWIKADTPHELRKRISEYVARLKGVEQVSEGDVAVLLSNEKALGEFAPTNRLGDLRTVRCDDQSEGGIVVDSIRRFKGLERPVVIVAATQDTVVDKELPYVALSRARTHLVIVGSEKVLSRMQGAIAQPSYPPSSAFNSKTEGRPRRHES
jgi:superfamily I DNA/RNA helicase